MRPSAMQLGSAPLTLDWSGLKIRTELTEEEIQPVWSSLKARFNEADVGFYDAPINESLSLFSECQEKAKYITSLPISDVLILGIGGSFLGPQSLLQALCLSPQKRIHFLDNPDPIAWHQTLRSLQPQSTFVISITKSGTTFETMALTLLALDWLGERYQKKHFLGMTDPKKGDLRLFLEQNQLHSLAIPPSIGGRFSLFSSVGILPGLLAGLDMQAFLQGASLIREFMEKTALTKNPLFLLAKNLILHFPQKPIHVMMPYTSELKGFSQWFVQLWAESLGKNEKGFTPLAALGAVDQHSLLQLLSDGPNDKILSFITIDQFSQEIKIPKTFNALAHFSQRNYAAFNILEDHRLSDLLNIEYQATAKALSKKNRLSYSLRMDHLSEQSCGALYYFYACLTSITGALWQINPFDQPGVEDTKVHIRELLTQTKNR
jgi:glucose-6-phosphate isomerase